MSPIFAYAAELYRQMRDEFELSVEAAHAQAEEGTLGAMLNKHGRAEGIDAYSLMTGPWARVIRYGSPELIEWCETYGRPSVAKFERQWFAEWQCEVPLPDAEPTEMGYRLASIRELATAIGEDSTCGMGRQHQTDIVTLLDAPVADLQEHDDAAWSGQ